jgi:flavin reductase (DIM6/NTAB) family NADH-FMN oxidoreductase RutF
MSVTGRSPGLRQQRLLLSAAKRKLPRSSLVAPSGVDGRSGESVPASAVTEAVLAKLPIGVAVITVATAGPPHGSTGMAWAEAVDPPLLLTTLRRAGTTRRLVAEQRAFGISLLSDSQSQLAWQFASKSGPAGERFAGAARLTGTARGIPLIDGSHLAFECDLEASYPFGQYDIVVGRVVSALARDNQPLVHSDGRLWRLSTIA